MSVRLFNTFEPVTNLYRELIPELVGRGTAVRVYTSRATYRAGRDLDAWLEGIPGASLSRLANLGLHARHGTLAKAVIGGLYFLDALARTLLAPGHHRNVLLTQPPFLPALGLILKRLRGQPYCVILMDLQPHLAAAVGVIGRGSPSYRILHRLNMTAIRGADRVIVIGRCMAETALREGVPEGNIRVIPNWVDPSRIRPVPHDLNTFRREMGWQDRFVVMYAGTLGYAQSMESLLAAAEKLRGDGDIRVVILGEGVRRAAVATRLESGAYPNVELHPFMHARYEMSEILAAADVHFVSLHPDVTGLAVPSKTYGIMAAGRPYIFDGSRGSEVARLAIEEGTGIAVLPRSPQAIADAVRQLATDPERAARMGERGRALAERGWNDGGGGAAIAAVIGELGHDSGGRVEGSS